MIPLESTIAYGPIRSRRFGWDLGINLLPVDRKICNFDCPYCQYGNSNESLSKHFPEPGDVIREWTSLVQRCQDQGKAVTHTTVAGNGEPTLHPQFSDVVRELVRWRDHAAPFMRLALLSNGSHLHETDVRKAVQLFDEPVMKLDAGSTAKIGIINRPGMRFVLGEYIQALQQCERLWIQSMFVKGWNDSPEEIEAWIQALRQIRPVEVQIYSVSRSPAQAGLVSLSQQELTLIATEASQRTGLNVVAYT